MFSQTPNPAAPTDGLVQSRCRLDQSWWLDITLQIWYTWIRMMGRAVCTAESLGPELGLASETG
jgi:hypothetical protein